MKHNYLFIGLISIVLSLFFILTYASALRESLTYDEIVHIEEGITAWKKHEFRVDTNNPPLIRELAVIPLLFQKNSEGHIAPNMLALPARMVIMAISLILGIAIILEVKKTFGIQSALLSTVLFSFEPLILANSHLITQDMGAALFLFLSYRSFLSFMKKPTWQAVVVHGICLGCMFSSKITTIPYYIVSVSLVVLFLFYKKMHIWLSSHLLKFTGVVFISLFFIWLTYFFAMNVIVAPSDAQGRVSQKVRAFASAKRNNALLAVMNFLEKQPVPLGDYIAVLKNTAIRSTRLEKTFFLGDYYQNPRWYFMLVTILLKTPVPFLLLSIAGAIIGLNSARFRRQTIEFCIPVISIIFISMISKLQPQVRYVLPIYPFLIGLASLSILNANRLKHVLIGILLLWYLSGSLGSFPHFISYANEFAGPKSKVYTKFTDSNLDWGQGLVSLKKEIDSIQPSVIHFSYFGRDDALKYGYPSNTVYGSYKANEICSFHDVVYPEYSGRSLTVISVSNWYECGYFQMSEFARPSGPELFANSFLLFDK